jgi:hypothetical protein
MRDALALANPKWRFVWGHTHEWRNHEVDPQCPANNFNDGSPIAGMVTYYQIDDGVVAGKEWK